MAILSEEQAFLQAFDELADPLFRHCYFRLFDREKAKDAVQETFVRVWKAVAAGKRITHMKAFLYQTARRIIIDEQRKNKHRQHDSLDEIKETGHEPSQTPTEQYHDRLEAERVMTACRSLAPEYQEVVQLRYVEGHTPAEIATMTGQSANRISVRLHRATQALRKLTTSV